MPSVVFLIIAIVAVGLLMLVAMMLTSKQHSFNKEEYQTRWLRVENGLDRNNPKSYVVAVMDADKVLDKALTEMGLSGKTMGEKLKKVMGKFERPSATWEAHRLRNRLAHQEDVEISYEQAKHALGAFKQALKDLGAI